MLRGGCLCGAARYELDAPLGPVIQCHCSQCRRASGSAFATNASARSEGFRVVQGGETLREFESSTGNTRVFCGRCGSPLYARLRGQPAIVRIRLGSLDDDPGVRPCAHVWVGSKAPWYEITDDLVRFDEEAPASYGAPG